MLDSKKAPNVVDIEELYRLRDNITHERGSVGEEQTDEEVLRAELEEESQSGAVDAEQEYEYVPISQVSNGIGSKLVGLLKEYYMVAGIALIVIACLLLANIGQNVKSIFIAIAFGVLVLGGAYILYEAWQDKKRAEAEYRHAKSVIEPVKEKIKEKGLK